MSRYKKKNEESQEKNKGKSRLNPFHFEQSRCVLRVKFTLERKVDLRNLLNSMDPRRVFK